MDEYFAFWIGCRLNDTKCSVDGCPKRKKLIEYSIDEQFFSLVCTSKCFLRHRFNSRLKISVCLRFCMYAVGSIKYVTFAHKFRLVVFPSFMYVCVCLCETFFEYNFLDHWPYYYLYRIFFSLMLLILHFRFSFGLFYVILLIKWYQNMHKMKLLKRIKKYENENEEKKQAFWVAHFLRFAWIFLLGR